jgi:DNA-binding CsgD family transcriptional regulator
MSFHHHTNKHFIYSRKSIEISFILALIIIPIQLCFSQLSQHQLPRIPLIHNFNSDEYHGGVQNWDITQDKRGILYVANNFGVMEFDGTDWELLSIKAGTRVLSILIDEDNTIYIGGQNQLGYLKSDKKGNFKYTSLIDLIPESERYLENVWKVYRHDKYILFNTNKYTYFYDGEKMLSKEMDAKGKNIFQVGSQLISYKSESGLLYWNGKDFEVLSKNPDLLNRNIIEILPHYNGGFLIFLTNGQILTFKDGMVSNWKNEMTSFFEESLINTACILDNNNIAIGTQNSGLVILRPDGSLEMEISKSKGLNSNTIYAVYQDQFKNIWLGLSNGLSSIDYGSPFALIDDRLGLPGTGYTACLSNGSVYLGTNNGLFVSSTISPLQKKSAIKYQIVDNSAGQVYSIAKYGNNLLMGHHQGAFRIDRTHAQNLYSKNGAWRFIFTPDGKGMLAGTYEGFVHFDRQLANAQLIDNFNESSRLFYFENDSILWMSHGFKGVYRLKFNPDYTKILKSDFYGMEKGFPSNILISVFEINNQLVFAAEHGIYSYNTSSDRFEPYAKLQDVLGSEKYVSFMCANHLGDVYYIRQNKFGQLKRNNFSQYELEEKTFNPINKYILSDDLENISIIDHENILIGAKEGFIHYNPTISKPKNEEFTTLIREIKVTYDSTITVYAGAELDTIMSAPLDPNLKSIRFRYAAPYLDGFSDLEYQYFLVGFDKDWSTPSRANAKEYTNLPYGEYTFKARSRNIYGDLSKIATYKFKINRPWYLTKLAIGAYILTTLLLFMTAMLWLDTKHKYDKKKMVINQKREIFQKELEIESVSKESEEEISKLKNEKLKVEIEYKTKELAASTMHILNKNEVMLDIKSKLESLSKNPNPKNDEIKKIVKNIDRNISEDKDWDQFTIHFDQVHDDFFKKLKDKFPLLTPQEIKMAAYLRMNLTSKEIAQLLNISVRGVEISRYRLRKKLTMDRETNLVTFLMDI